MQICDICGTFNLRENNYCTHCGNKLIIENICPYCGQSNSNDTTFCAKCNKQINPITIDDWDILFGEYNCNLLKNASVTDEEYNQILSNIFLRAKHTLISGKDIKEKIINFANIFTKCCPKSRGYERGYNFLGSLIFYDDRLEDSTQIATIIHELAHYLLFTIIESLLCHIFKVNSSSTLQSFVWYFLTLPEFKIMNEYCAHTVEGRFIPFGYQNYGSFNMVIEELDYDADSLRDMVIFGNTFANEIIVYLEKFITEDLRNEIKLQYRKDLNVPSYESIQIETEDCLPLSVKNQVLIELLYKILKLASNEDVRKELDNIKEGIEFY